MATPPPTSSGFTVPTDIRAQFPEIIGLIEASKSMNDSERQYWVNMLPVMKQDQLTSLQSILINERDELKAIEAKFATSATQAAPVDVRAIGEERTKQRTERTRKEDRAEEEEAMQEKSILDEIGNA